MKIKHIFLCISFSVFTINAYCEFFPPQSVRDIAWGSPVSAITEPVSIIEDSKGMKCYSKDNEKLKIGDAEIESVSYCFYKDQFYFAKIAFEGYSNYSIIKDTMIQKYEKPYQGNQFVEEYMWGLTSDVTIELKYSDVTKKGSVTYAQIPISLKQQQEQREKNKSATGDI